MGVFGTYPGKKILSLCLIAKNESKHVKRFIDSWKGWYDELFICDTGSEDDTVKIAEMCGATILHFDWCNSFALARNHSISQATSEWIFCPDVDEVMFDPENFYKFLAEAPERINAVQIDLHTAWDDYIDWQNHGPAINVFPAQRCFRTGTHEWVGAAHEFIKAINGNTTTMGYCRNAHFEHHPDPTKSRAFYIDILRKEANENPNEGRYLHYMGREAMYYGLYVEAIGYFQRCLEFHHWDFERCQTRLYMASCYLHTKEDDKALEQLCLALMEEPSRRDPTFAIGEFYRNREQWAKAITWYKMCIGVDRPDTSYFMNEDLYGCVPYLRLAHCYWSLNDIAGAQHYFNKAKEMEPNNEEVLKNNHLFLMPKVGVVIPTRFREQYLNRTLKLLEETVKLYPNMEVTVVRDEKEKPDGCPKSVNKGVQYALSSEGKPDDWVAPDYICFLGNDTTPQGAWLNEAMFMMKEFPGGRGMVGFNNGYSAGAGTHFVIHKDLINELPDKKLFWEGYTHNFVDNELQGRMEAKGLYKWCGKALVGHTWHSQKGTSPGLELRQMDACDLYAANDFDKDYALFLERKKEWYSPLTFGVQVLFYKDKWIIDETLDRLLQEFSPEDIIGVTGEPFSGLERENDGTTEAFTKRGIRVIDCGTDVEHLRRNKALKELDKDYCFIVDADEFWDVEDLKSVKQIVTDNRTIECILTRCYTYWKTKKWRIDPPEPLTPPVLVKRGVEFTNCRLNNAKITAAVDNIYFHHYSYVGDDSRIKEKLAHLNAPGFRELHPVIDGWFDNVWKKWDVDNTLENLHPTHPECYKRAVKVC